jgi:pimeloyl-ACP methyl ester carboxylesterase
VGTPTGRSAAGRKPWPHVLFNPTGFPDPFRAGEELTKSARSPITKYAMYTKLGTVAFVGLVIGAAAIVIGFVSGLPYEQAQRARDRELFPQVGRSVDIGGRALNIYCSGAGQPAVIFESGSPWLLSDPRKAFENGEPRPGYSWVWIQSQLAKTTTACWYDRAGSGWSDLGPYPRDSISQARDLRALLRAAAIPPPYVLVAEVSAALDAHVYAGSWPEDVSGLVLVNGVHPDLLVKTRPGSGRIAFFPAFVGHSEDEMAQLFNQVGLYRLGLPNGPAPAAVPEGMTPSEWNTIWHLTQSSRARSALIQETASWQRSADEAGTAGSLGDRPLIVVSGQNAVASEHQSVWMELQTELARLSTRGKLVTVGEGREDLIYRAPGTVIDATRQVVDDVRQLRRSR